MHSLLRQLPAHTPVIAEGAWGTQLEARGRPLAEFPEAWKLPHFDL